MRHCLRLVLGGKFCLRIDPRFFAFYQMSSTLRFFGFGAAATGVILCHLALVSAVVLPVGTVESRKGLGEFIQASLLLSAAGVATGSIGTAIKTN